MSRRGTDVSMALARVVSKRLADAFKSPELLRTIEELSKGYAAHAKVSIRKQHTEIAGVATVPAMKP